MTGFCSYSNMFLTNLLNRAFLNSALNSVRGGTTGHISLVLSPLPRGDEQGPTGSSFSGERYLGFSGQKSTGLDGSAV